MNSQSIEKFKLKGSTPHYTLELSLVCKNCGTPKGRWLAASDSATSFDFIMTTCEYCGVFRFEATLYARFYDSRDKKNLEKAHARFDYELRADAESDKRLKGPKTIKKVEGERVE